MDLNMDIETKQGKVPVTVVRPHGRIDGSTYESLIQKTGQLYTNGTRHLLLDLGDVNFLSSAGLVALHSMILVMRGEKVSDLESGWEALHDIDRDTTGTQPYVKLLNPQPKVLGTLQNAAMDRFFSIFTDEGEAVLSRM